MKVELSDTPARRALLGAAIVALLVGGSLWTRQSWPFTPFASARQAEIDRTKEAERSKRKAQRAAERKQKRANTPPNVLLIVWDTVRADHLSLYGHAHDTTPNLKRMSRRSLVFDHAVSPAIWTVPAHASIFTGLPASSHGADFEWKWLDNHFVTMAEWLGDTGYETWAFSANAHVSRKSNLLQGFETVHHPSDLKWRGKAKRHIDRKLHPEDRSTRRSPKWQPSELERLNAARISKDGGPLAITAMMDWLATRDDDKPFFAFVNYMEAHVPRVPPMRARKELFGAQGAKAQISFDQAYPTMMQYAMGKREFTDREIQLISDTYDASLLELDRTTGKLLDKLRDKGVLANTIVIVTADHGEHLGEHHKMGHKYSVYEPLAHVPLMIYAPGRVEPGRVAETVSTAQILSTVSELTGVEAPAASVAPSLLEAERDNVAVVEMNHPAPLVAQVMVETYPDLDPTPFMKSLRGIVKGREKLVTNEDGSRELYDLSLDPLEEIDLSGVEQPRAEALQTELSEWLGAIPPYDASKRTEEDGPKTNAAHRAQLAALGYVEEGDDEEGEGIDEVEP